MWNHWIFLIHHHSVLTFVSVTPLIYILLIYIFRILADNFQLCLWQQKCIFFTGSWDISSQNMTFTLTKLFVKQPNQTISTALSQDTLKIEPKQTGSFSIVMVCRNVHCQDKFLPIGLSTNMEVFYDLPLAVKFPQLTLSRKRSSLWWKEANSDCY